VTIHPDPSGWVRALTHASPDGAARAARAELGLPVDRPIVMSGHQAGFWHAGILAKWLAGDACARVAGAGHAWVVVDQDTSSPLTLRWPERDADGRWQERTHDAGAGPHPDAATGCRPRVDDASLPSAFAKITDPLRNAGGGSSAEQVAEANARLIEDRLGVATPTFIYATRFGTTAAFQELLDTMASDPRACVEAYNGAVAAHPDAGLRPLIARGGRFELPVWRVTPDEPRRVVMAHEAEDVPRDEIAPRALLMTAFLRLVACDLFVHGTGGASYDRATDAWIGAWIGRPLAPTAVATATVRLDLGTAPATENQVAAARWRAHTARHRPGLLGDESAESERRSLVTAIRNAPWKSAERAERFAALHAFERAHRDRHAQDLDGLQREADRLAATRADIEITTDRTWPWVLHTDAALARLRDEMQRAFDPAHRTRMTGNDP
jgi:hypothetical protein